MVQGPHFWSQRDSPSWSYAVLASVSRGCSPLEGKLLTRYAPFRHYLLRDRSTCMPNPRRQRSLWARIKLSNWISIRVFVLAYPYFTFPESVVLDSLWKNSVFSVIPKTEKTEKPPRGRFSKIKKTSDDVLFSSTSEYLIQNYQGEVIRILASPIGEC